MPLLDHFHPPLSEQRHWESFHASWANEIMAALNNGALPAGYFADTQVHFGAQIEIDVATLHSSGQPVASPADNGGVAVQTEPATGVLLMPAIFPDTIEVQVLQRSGGPTLVAAIELIGPRNKDRPEARRAFAVKVAAYLQLGIGVLIVDIVADRHANLHDELIQLLQQEAIYRFPTAALLYTVAYRPLRTESSGDQIESRPMPLSLRGGPVVQVDLDATYSNTRQRSLL
jgi:hypothetical protein